MSWVWSDSGDSGVSRVWKGSGMEGDGCGMGNLGCGVGRDSGVEWVWCGMKVGCGIGRVSKTSGVVGVGPCGMGRVWSELGVE